MRPSVDQTHFALAALAVIYVAEQMWTLTAKIISFFDKRSVANKKLPEDKRAKRVPSKTRAKLPILGHQPHPQKPIAASNPHARKRIKRLRRG
jgi:hypothetical protein